MAEGVYLEVTGKPRLKLKFTHKALRAVVETTKKSIGDLLSDPFGGWPYLIQAAGRLQQPRMTVDDASDLIDAIVAEGKSLNDISDRLGAALESAGYIKFARDGEAEATSDVPNEPRPS